jgi:hypothetical protein
MEQLFRCTRCDTVDMKDIADSEAALNGKEPKPFVCTKCQTGQWHGQFEAKPYDPTKDEVMNPRFPQNCS